MRAVVRVFSHEPARGALPTLYAATAPDVRGGEYFGPSGFAGCLGPPAAPARAAARATRRWRAASSSSRRS
jgi:hypothetical protein